MNLRRQRQTIFGDRKGNCFSTCVACMFEVSTEEVPNFCGDFPPETWWAAFLEWLASRGWTAIHFPADDDWASRMRDVIPGLTVIAGGDGPRGCLHAVLMRDGRLLHDPHPDGTGLESVADVTVLVPLEWPGRSVAGGAA